MYIDICCFTFLDVAKLASNYLSKVVLGTILQSGVLPVWLFAFLFLTEMAVFKVGSDIHLLWAEKGMN
jgi:hypothetical protein